MLYFVRLDYETVFSMSHHPLYKNVTRYVYNIKHTIRSDSFHVSQVFTTTSSFIQLLPLVAIRCGRDTALDSVLLRINAADGRSPVL